MWKGLNYIVFFSYLINVLLLNRFKDVEDFQKMYRNVIKIEISIMIIYIIYHLISRIIL